MTETIHTAKARESIKSGFVELQYSEDRETWYTIDHENPEEYIDYYCCAVFGNGRHIPLPLLLDAVYPFWSGQHADSYADNTLQLRTIRYWLKKTGLLDDYPFISMLNWAMDNYYNNFNQMIEPVVNCYRVMFNEFKKRYAEKEDGRRLYNREEAYYLCHDKIKEFTTAFNLCDDWKIIFECVASAADFTARLICPDSEYWLIFKNGEIDRYTIVK